jgi:hypothetical protein
MIMRSIISCGFFGFVAWLTHVIVCLNTAQWGFLIAGAIFFPVAIVHGIGIWVGYWPGIWWH